MAWQAKPGCAEHHRTVIERMVNAFPPAWLLPPCTGEIFDSLEHCNRRLKGFSLAEGFDIVRKGGGTKVHPAYRFLSTPVVQQVILSESQVLRPGLRLLPQQPPFR